MTALFDDSILPETLIKALSIPATLWNAPRTPVSSNTGSRTCDTESFLSRSQEAARRLGMTRLANLTGLDTLGIPVFSATCPLADEGLITVFNGKGINEAEASVSALMELVERISASARNQRMIYGTYADLQHLFSDQVINPSQLILHRRTIPIEVIPLSWTWVFDFGRNTPVLVPATAVYHPFYDDSGPLFVNNSCGLASGSSLLEAVIQALYEVIERDAVSLAMASNFYTSVPLATIDSPICKELLASFDHANIRVAVKEVTTDLGVPCFVASSDDVNRCNSFYLNGGYGCHSNREKALTRAIVELAQSRATIISGAREDISEMREGDGSDYHEIRQANYCWFTDVEPMQPYNELPTMEFDNLWSELGWIVERVRAVGLPGPFVAGLTQPAVGIPVVRVLVPGLECWHRDRQRIGSRLVKAFKIGRKLSTVRDGTQEGQFSTV